jgi:ATP-dependent Clp protease protease subunit
MIGHINITGQIGSFDGAKGIELIDVISQVQRQKEAEAFFVYIDSPGGGVDDGDSIYSYLKSLPQRITTVGFGRVASIATKVMLAGEERIMISGQSGFMIHNPWVKDVIGDADELMNVSEEIRKEEEKLITFYSESTGISKEGLSALMKYETDMPPERALELGFITKVIRQDEAQGLGMVLPGQLANVKALAFTKEKKDTKMSKEISEKLDKVLTFLNLKKEEKPTPKALVLSDSNGAALNILKADGTEVEGLPAAGDMVTIDGQPANGTFIIPDKKLTIEAKEGKVTAVTEEQAAPEANPELEQAKSDLAAANAKISELQAKEKEYEAFKVETVQKLALVEKTLKATAGSFVPKGRETTFGKEKESDSVTKAEMKKRRESYKKQN